MSYEMEELYETIKSNLDGMLACMDKYEEHEDYTEEERMYDEGYCNALRYVMEIVTEV